MKMRIVRRSNRSTRTPATAPKMTPGTRNVRISRLVAEVRRVSVNTSTVSPYRTMFPPIWVASWASHRDRKRRLRRTPIVLGPGSTDGASPGSRRGSGLIPRQVGWLGPGAPTHHVELLSLLAAPGASARSAAMATTSSGLIPGSLARSSAATVSTSTPFDLGDCPEVDEVAHEDGDDSNDRDPEDRAPEARNFGSDEKRRGGRGSGAGRRCGA